MSTPQQPAPPPADDPQRPQQPAAPSEPTMIYTVLSPGDPRTLPPQLPMSGQVPGPGYGPRPGPFPPRPVHYAPQRPARIDAQVVRVLYAGLGLVGVVLGVSLPAAHGIGWGAFTAWSIFATLCALTVLAAAASYAVPWSLQAAACAGLVLFWLIAVRPVAVSDVGFLMTLGVAGAATATALDPRARLPRWRGSGPGPASGFPGPR